VTPEKIANHIAKRSRN